MSLTPGNSKFRTQSRVAAIVQPQPTISGPSKEKLVAVPQSQPSKPVQAVKAFPSFGSTPPSSQNSQSSNSGIESLSVKKVSNFNIGFTFDDDDDDEDDNEVEEAEKMESDDDFVNSLLQMPSSTSTSTPSAQNNRLVQSRLENGDGGESDSGANSPSLLNDTVDLSSSTNLGNIVENTPPESEWCRASKRKSSEAEVDEDDSSDCVKPPSKKKVNRRHFICSDSEDEFEETHKRKISDNDKGDDGKFCGI